MGHLGDIESVLYSEASQVWLIGSTMKWSKCPLFRDVLYSEEVWAEPSLLSREVRGPL